MILVVDNTDSFVHNLARTVGELGRARTVVRSDALTVEAAAAMAPAAIIISPGPCTPAEAGVSCALIEALGPRTPILGVCLGHQCIAAVYGGRVERARIPVHGKASAVRHHGRGLFADLPSPLRAGRYHSLVVEVAAGGPLAVDATTDDGTVMAISHQSHPVYGVQFHPESILTEHGDAVVANFLDLADGWWRARWRACG